MASLGSKIFLAGSCALTGGTIWMVHKSQVDDRAALRQGIVRDLERQEKKKVANLHKLQEQQEIEKSLRRRQNEEAKETASQS